MALVQSSADIIRLFKQAQVEAPREFPQDVIERYLESRVESEIKLQRSIPICPFNLPPSAPKAVAELNGAEFRRLLRTRLYDATVLQTLRCVFGQVLQVSSARRLLRIMTPFSLESVSGFAYRCDIPGAADVFVLKLPREEHRDIEIVHEYIVGTLGLNLLRSQVPNFSYIFAGFQCLPPIPDLEGKVITWCTRTQGKVVPYILHEYIGDSIAFGEYVKTCKPQEFLQMYVQVLLALRLAVIVSDFTHYDLHAGNVLIRRITKLGVETPEEDQFYIRYDTPWGPRYLLSNRVATIIDYGMSHIQYLGEHYGSADFPELGILPNSSFPLFDAYKLLLFCMDRMSRAKNVDTFKVASQVFRIFNTTDQPLNVLLEQRKYYYGLPATPENVSKSLDDVLLALASTVKLDFLQTTPRRRIRILECTASDPCMTPLEVSNVLKTINITSALDLQELPISQRPANIGPVLEATRQRLQIEIADVQRRLVPIKAYTYPTTGSLEKDHISVALQRHVQEVVGIYDILSRIRLLNGAFRNFSGQAFPLRAEVDALNKQVGQLSRYSKLIGTVIANNDSMNWLRKYLPIIATLPLLTEFI